MMLGSDESKKYQIAEKCPINLEDINHKKLSNQKIFQGRIQIRLLHIALHIDSCITSDPTRLTPVTFKIILDN